MLEMVDTYFHKAADCLGGVALSYFEWTQNIQQFRRDHEKVNPELDKIMKRAYDAVRQTARTRDVDLWTASLVVAIERAARAALSRVHLRQKIEF